MDLLPPSRDAFNQHVKRANFQSRIWKESGAPMQNVGDPVNHGWNRDEEGLYHAIGFENTIAPKDIIELVRCGCQTGCVSQRRRCLKNGLCCTDM